MQVDFYQLGIIKAYMYCYITHSGMVHSPIFQGDVSESRYYEYVNIKINTVTFMRMVIHGIWIANWIY
jgi:hypothetical protein